MYIIFGAIFNLIATIILIPRFKSYGAAVGSIIAESVINFFYFSRCEGFYTVKQLALSAYKKFIAAIIMFVYLFFMDKYLNLQNWLVLAIQVIGGASIYFVILLILRDKAIKTLLEMKIFDRFRKKKNK